MAKNLRVCYFGTYRSEYSRNQIMIEGLRRAGVEVLICHQELWRGIEDRVQAASGGWINPTFLIRVLHTYWCLLRDHKKIKTYDVMVVGYPGQLDIFLARFLSWWRKRPLVCDIFMSIYLIALERGLKKKSAITLRLIYLAEMIACRLPDMLILDTSEYADWYQKTYRISPKRIRLVPTGADDRFFLLTNFIHSNDSTVRVIYHGTYIPNHGVETIIEAAKLLSDLPEVHFELIGEGPERIKAISLACEYDLHNLTFVEWLDKTELAHRLEKADILLGAFGITPQSLMTIQNKIFEGLAMGKPVITGDSPAIRSVFLHGVHIYVCERQNPQALADAIRFLFMNPELRKKISLNGSRIYYDQFDLDHNGQRLAKYLMDLV